MATIKFYLNPREKQDGTCSLKLAVHLNRTTQRKDIGIQIPKKLWSDAKQQILGDYNGVSKLALNNALLKHKTKASETLFELTQTGDLASMTAKEFCLKLSDSCPTQKKVSFPQYCDEYIQRQEDIGKIGTAKANRYALNTFLKYHKKDLTFDEVNYLLIKKFDESLIKQQLSTNGRAMIHRQLRSMYGYAAKELEYVNKSSNPYLDFQVRQEPTKKRNISIDEIRSLYNYHGEHDLGRDMFMFGFFCVGMDIVDICYLKPENIVKGRIEYARKKVTRTKRSISIKIEPEMQEIIDKYSHSGFYLFPFLEGCASDEERYLKHENVRHLTNTKLGKIKEELEIDATVTTKVSRHSWASTAKDLYVPNDVISEMLGHKTAGVDVTNTYLGDYKEEVKDDWNRKVIDTITGEN